MWDLPTIGTYIFTAFLGGWFFKLVDWIVHKATRAREIERAHYIELARYKIRQAEEGNEAAFIGDVLGIEKSTRKYNCAVQLAKQVYEIDKAALGRFWARVGQPLGRRLDRVIELLERSE